MDAMERLMEEAAQVLEFKSVTSSSRSRVERVPAAHTCQECGQRRPLFCLKGTVKADRMHTLCFECYRALVNRTRAGRALPLAVRVQASPLPGPARARGDKAAFDADLSRRRRRAIQAARHALDGLTTTLPTFAAPDLLERVS